MTEIQERKQVSQQVVDRMLYADPKFIADLNKLFDKYPVKREVIYR